MSSDLSPGAVFTGRYRIERRIASGGMGAVYEVVHLETNRRRALKVMHAHFVQSDELRGRFRQEARVAAEIESEHIVDVFDAGIDESTGQPFLVMELLRGEELATRLRRTGAMPFGEVVSFMHQTALALDKTHKASIVHRDLKPDNLFLCEREEGPPRIKVLDFGIAKIVADGSARTAATQSLGTPLYMAPEQFLMDVAVSPATDIYALGQIAYTFLVGKPYWHEETKTGASVFAFAATAAMGPKESATARAARQGVTLPPAFDAWFAQVAARQPAERFPSATAAVKALAEALDVPLSSPLGASLFGPPSLSRARMPSYTDESQVGPFASVDASLGPLATTGPSSQNARVFLQSSPGVEGAASLSGSLGSTGDAGSNLLVSAGAPRTNTKYVLAGAGVTFLIAGLVLYGVSSSSSGRGPATGSELGPVQSVTAPASAATEAPPVIPAVSASASEGAPAASASAAEGASTKKVPGTTSTSSSKTGTAPPQGTTTSKKGRWVRD